MLNESNPTTNASTPAVVLCVGDFAIENARQVRAIYLRGDERRQSITRFFALAKDESQAVVVTPIEQYTMTEGTPAETRQTNAARRQQFFQQFINNAANIRKLLGETLHEIMVDTNLMKAGWGGEPVVPVNIYILADLKEPFAASLILPVMSILQDMISSLNYCQVFFLLNAGMFPSDLESSPAEDIEVYTALLELDGFLQGKSPSREKLNKALGLSDLNFIPPHLFLLDSNKFGAAVVEDNQKMGILVGNALLALLEGDTARKICEKHDCFEMLETKHFYSSIGAAVIVYDPASLLEICTQRVAHEYLADQVLAEQADARRASGVAAGIQSELQSLPEWLQGLVFQLPDAISGARFDTSTLELSFTLPGLKFQELDFESIHTTPWAQQIRDFEASFHGEILPEVKTKIEVNYATLIEKLEKQLRSALDGLPRLAELYPGWPANANLVLDEISKNLEREEKRIQDLRANLNRLRSALGNSLEQDLNKMEALFRNAPRQPIIFKIIPRFIRQHLLLPFYTWRYGKQLYEISQLRSEVVQFIHRKSALLIEEQALEQLAGQFTLLKEIITAQKQAFDELKAKFETALQKTSPDWPAFPLGSAENGWHEVFRLPAVHPQFATWAYQAGHPQLETWPFKFTAEDSLFADWRVVEPERILEWVLNASQAAYCDYLWKIDLERIFQFWQDEQQPSQEVPLSANQIENCINASLPLLRPNMDAFDSSQVAAPNGLAVLGSADWQICCLPEMSSPSTWDTLYSYDPFAIVFIRVQHMVPLNALVELIRAGRQKYEALSPEKRLAYAIIDSLNAPMPSMVESTDPKDPDLVHKQFAWKFKPKGSGKEYNLSFDLAISKARFEYFRRQPRLQEQWNHYAELEMPEVRRLALAFQKIHSEYGWSTYNQAANILAFVQSIIQYRFDQDSTGYAEWPRYPIETLMEGIGDCEDVAILCAAVIARLGLQVVLLLYPKHLAFGVAGADKLKGDYIIDPLTGQKFFYGEATSKGWHLGQIPAETLGKPVEQILPVKILMSDEDGEGGEKE